MADFKISWRITASWEGRWTNIPETYKDKQGVKHTVEEEKYGNVWWGTNFGLTGVYMRDYTTWKSEQKATFQKMNQNECGDIWKETRWKWLKADQIESQELANLVFDWSVRRWQSCVNGVRNAIGQGNATAETNIIKTVKGKKVIVTDKGNSLIGSGDAYSIWISMKSVGGKPMNPNAGFFILTDLAIEEFNARAKMPNNAFFNALKALRKAKDKPDKASVIDRYDSFLSGGTPTKDQWEKMRDKRVPVGERTTGVKFNLVQKQADLNGDTEGSYGTYVLGAFALLIGYKWFKNRKKR